MRKRAFVHMLTAKTQSSLRFRAVWSGRSLSNRINGHYGEQIVTLAQSQ